MHILFLIEYEKYWRRAIETNMQTLKMLINIMRIREKFYIDLKTMTPKKNRYILKMNISVRFIYFIEDRESEEF